MKKKHISSAHEAQKILRSGIPSELIDVQEGFVAVALNAKHEVIDNPWLVALGTLAQVDVHMRDIFREAVRRNAAKILVAHNHPSGDLVPSNDDIRLTYRIVESGKLLGISLLDHLILGQNENYFSFAAQHVGGL